MNEVVIDSAIEEVVRVFPKLIEMLNEEDPDLVDLYEKRFNFAIGPYPPQVKYRNAVEILSTYFKLMGAGK